jgi:hypothetical protein
MFLNLYCLLGDLSKLRNRLFISSCLFAHRSVGQHGTIGLRMDGLTDCLKMIFWEFVKNLLWKFNLNENLTIIKDNLHEDIYSCMIISRSTVLTINDSVKDSSKNQNTHFVFSIFVLKICFYELMWKIMAMPDTSQMSMLTLALYI